MAWGVEWGNGVARVGYDDNRPGLSLLEIIQHSAVQLVGVTDALFYELHDLCCGPCGNFMPWLSAKGFAHPLKRNIHALGKRWREHLDIHSRSRSR